MSRYENHIATGLGTQSGLFQGVCRSLIALHVHKNEQIPDNRIYQESGKIQGSAILSFLPPTPKIL
jgi:hypothetical protein